MESSHRCAHCKDKSREMRWFILKISIWLTDIDIAYECVKGTLSVSIVTFKDMEHLEQHPAYIRRCHQVVGLHGTRLSTSVCGTTSELFVPCSKIRPRVAVMEWTQSRAVIEFPVCSVLETDDRQWLALKSKWSLILLFQHRQEGPKIVPCRGYLLGWRSKCMFCSGTSLYVIGAWQI